MAMPSVLVATLFRDNWGEGHGLRYIANLRRAVQRHLTVEHRFYVVTEPDLEYDWPGWWSKLEIQRPGFFDEQRIIFFDLDTIIVGNIDFLATYPGRFATLRDFYRPQGLQSAVMVWDGAAGTNAPAYFRDVLGARPVAGGDQSVLEMAEPEAERLQDLYPGKIVTYKPQGSSEHLMSIPPKASVICFHGRPRPHEVIYRGHFLHPHWS